ncbi:MAG: orotidine-5'-phosphate decarboxylase [Candidatus Kapabacteria bacterium]|jgi:orotidine-5'-phosphate decarboxylase|nr:orotidine-5'-phosphate decarboxylase [Candidatus Kapabacteria bacterium]
MNTYKKLEAATKKNNSILCCGLDSDVNKIPEFLGRDLDGILEFNRLIIEATKDLVNSYKINFAFYEQYGTEGFDILKKTFEFIPDDIVTIADAKRGDIGNTSKSYAKSCFEYFNADSITVNPYMGYDSYAPFLEYEDKMVFLLALTSNPGSADFQRLIADGKPIYRHVFEKTMARTDDAQLGYVVGATHPDELADLRAIAPKRVLLIPGVGAQGGDVESVIKANTGGPCVINASRGIIYASAGKDFAEKAREKTEFFRAQFNR